MNKLKEAYKTTLNLIGFVMFWSFLYIILFGGNIKLESEGLIVLLFKWVANLF